MPKIYLGLLLAVGTSAIGYFYVTAEWKKFAELREESTHFSETEKELGELAQEYDRFLESAQTIAPHDIERIDTSLPLKPPVKEFPILLEYLAARSGLAIQEIALPVLGDKNASDPERQEGTVASSIPRPIDPGISRISRALRTTPKKITTEMKVAGPYQALRKFLQEVEGTIPFLEVEKITMQSSRGDEKLPRTTLSLTFTLATYYQ
ncbi:MAG: hypothetical protein G01um101466_403 [Parcubacteria group bacterium Gr01-1014_66]|nr:MAG: hypothetical protein G01um101466_403 [Parcubacteria group bacterium Gr01-1014_66]